MLICSGYLGGPDLNDINIEEVVESTKEGLEGDEEEALPNWLHWKGEQQDQPDRSNFRNPEIRF